MDRMAQWAVIIPADRWATERLFHSETLTVSGSGAAAGSSSAGLSSAGVSAGLSSGAAGVVSSPASGPQAGDEAVLVAGDEPHAVALGRFTSATEVAYTRRAFDEPAPLGDLTLAAPLTPLEPGVFREVAARLGGDRDRRTWLVSVDMPIEATSPGEAVRQFWSYVRELGPAELPTFVWPSGDELAMQAFVLGQEANQDPEEDDEDD
jgi:hypothetical protein